jgi:hypothetical protein
MPESTSSATAQAVHRVLIGAARTLGSIPPEIPGTTEGTAMKKKIIAGAAGLVLATGVGLSMPVLAYAEPLGSNDIAGASSASATSDGPDGRRHGAHGPDAAALAEKLGLSEAAVSNAISAVRDQLDPPARPEADATEDEREAAREARQTAFAEALAAELDIDVANVTAALAELQTERETAKAAADEATLEQAVADGDLTQAEADAVQKAIDAGIVVIRGGGPGGS